jgi:hypothetical protein
MLGWKPFANLKIENLLKTKVDMWLNGQGGV